MSINPVQTPDGLKLGDMNMDAEFGDVPAKMERPTSATSAASVAADLDTEAHGSGDAETVAMSKADLARLQQYDEYSRVAKIVEDFKARHAADYTPTPKNGQALERYFVESGIPITPESVEDAFQELNAAGALERPRRPQTASGLPDRGHRVPQRDKTADLEEQVQNLPIEEARDLILAEFHKQKRKSGMNYSGSSY